jgi:hypothetical protein
MRKTAAGILCTLFGFAVGYGLLDGAPAIYTSMLVSYHLFLVYLIVTANHEKGMSLPIGSTIVTHMACLIVILGMAFGRQHIPLFGLLKYLVPALAPFEADWLFSGGRKQKGKKEVVEPPPIPMPEGTADDYNEFLAYLAQEKRPFSKPGRSVREEHVLWMADRAHKEAVATAAAAAVSARQRSATPAPQ